jgi:hypothetical protein
MPREPLTIIYDFSSAGQRRYVKGERPGKFERTGFAEMRKSLRKLPPAVFKKMKTARKIKNCKDDNNYGKEKNSGKKTAEAAGR